MTSFWTNLDDNVRKVVGEEHEVPPAVVDQLLVIPLLIFLVVPNQVPAVPQLVPDAELNHGLLVFLPAVTELLLHRGWQRFPGDFAADVILYLAGHVRHLD